MKKLYPWTRFWVPQGGAVLLDDRGYLKDSDRLKSDAVKWDRMSSLPCLVLLGEPGIGKSITLEQSGIAVNDATHIYINLRGHSDQKLLNDLLFGSSVLQHWKTSDGALEITLDSLDECLLHIETVAAWLADELTQLPNERLHLRIACRTAEWPRVLDESIRSNWDRDKVGFFELAPLRRADVRIAAEVDGLDASNFLRAVEAAGAVPLAINPNTLGFLIGEYGASQSLPSDPAELYRLGCSRLCAESPTRSRKSLARTIPLQHRVAIAERICASMIFGRKSSLYLGDAADKFEKDVLLLSDLEGDDALSGRTVNISTEMVAETARSALFNGRAPEHVGVSHWTFGEFMAARFCVTRDLSLDQISELLFHPDSGKRPQVVPQLGETAAWVASMNSELLFKIAKNDPGVLLRSNVLAMAPDARAALTASLLELADRGEIFDDHEMFKRIRYDVLKHPGLHEQLLPYVQESRNPVARRMAMNIAGACSVTSLAPVLAERANDPHEDTHVRSNAAHAVLELNDTNAHLRLRPLLSLPESEDPQDSLKGNALRALWPDHLDANLLFESVTAPRRYNLMGAYAFFVQFELSRRLRREHLPAGLAWIQRMPQPLKAWHCARDLAADILKLAFENTDVREVRDPFISVVLDRLSRYEAIFQKEIKEDEKPILSIAENRRRLVELLVPVIALEADLSSTLGS